ncbi:ABC transporter ATP-binding protein [Actinomyces wuliandei]|uniref:ABC transporter ATP-binding protein n=1 Tax=Actinomyces wuliandei TaxID=2057743 RepID=UPI00111B2B0F|nr:ATP-binding cassette domain-containing protein [Actinomyces wuliandei]
MITIEALTKRYHSKLAVDDVTFKAIPGRVTGLLGPNGAGKSTTMRLILGLEEPNSGKALVNGKAYRSLGSPLRVVGAQFDGSGSHRGRTARAHLNWVSLSNGIPLSRVSDVLELVGLSGVSRRRVGSFSPGMEQRIGIATAMLGDLEILVLDEPMNGLDAEGIRWVRGLVRGLAEQGRTVLVSSHLMGEVEAIADDLVVLAQGRVVRQGAVSDLVKGYASLEEAYFKWTDGRNDYAATVRQDSI